MGGIPRSIPCGALLGVLAACASAGTIPPPSAQTSNVVLIDDGPTTTVHSSAPVASTASTALQPDSVMALLSAAYQASGIPVTLVDPAGGRIGNPRLMVRGRLAGATMSRWISCGQTMMTNHADRDQITMSVVSTVRRSSTGGSTVETLLTATARDRSSGNVGDFQNCSTTGEMETRLHRMSFGG